MAASGSTLKLGRYLLDTNIVTALFKQDAAVLAELTAGGGRSEDVAIDAGTESKMEGDLLMNELTRFAPASLSEGFPDG